MSLRKWTATNFTFLGKYKRFLMAIAHSLSNKKTYSQHGEDVFILETLKQYNLTGSLFLDIGANHPTDISNTYLLYRNGLNGIVIEPNEELISLFSRFRNRDIALMIGCSNKTSLMKFNISRTPVMSSFISEREDNFYKASFIPVLMIDDALSNIEFTFINFLSIDVEGLNVEVLEGAAQTLKKTLLVCIEYDNDQEKAMFTKLLGDGFTFINEFGCNVIYLNRFLSERIKGKY